MDYGEEGVKQSVRVFEVQRRQPFDLQTFVLGYVVGDVVVAGVDGDVIAPFSKAGIEVLAVVLDAAPCCRYAPEACHGNFYRGEEWRVVTDRHRYLLIEMACVKGGVVFLPPDFLAIIPSVGRVSGVPGTCDHSKSHPWTLPRIFEVCQWPVCSLPAWSIRIDTPGASCQRPSRIRS